jgi:thymidylate synthase
MKSIHIVEETLPVAWENAVIACWDQGDSFPTQYDKPNDPNSRDVLACIHVKNPFAEPRIHRSFPGGLADLEKYRAEVLFGVHDYWMHDTSNPNRWEYTYHQRLFDYETQEEITAQDGTSWKRTINQIDKCVEMLKKCGYTRRAQAITWQPWNDLGIHDPACLQRLWFRVQDGKLNMTVNMRSNDAYKAAFMNMYAFTELQNYVAFKVGVAPGEYIHIADSFHIYGSYFKEFEGFLQLSESRSIQDKVWDSSFATDFFVEGCDELLAEPNMPEHCKKQVEARKQELERRIS